MKVIKNEKTVLVTYEDLCKDLGFIPDVNFVKVTNRGTITFTAGKMFEVKMLYRKAVDKGYKPSIKLANICKHI